MKNDTVKAKPKSILSLSFHITIRLCSGTLIIQFCHSLHSKGKGLLALVLWMLGTLGEMFIKNLMLKISLVKDNCNCIMSEEFIFKTR